MTIEQVKEKLGTSEYNFLKTDSHLGSHVILLTLGGSRGGCE